MARFTASTGPDESTLTALNYAEGINGAAVYVDSDAPSSEYDLVIEEDLANGESGSQTVAPGTYPVFGGIATEEPGFFDALAEASVEAPAGAETAVMLVGEFGGDVFGGDVTLLSIPLGADPDAPPEEEPAPDSSGRTANSEDPTEASLLLSQDTFGEDSANVVVLGRNDVFADNLAGAGLAAADEAQTGGPLLLVPPAPAALPESVTAEIGRVTGGPDQPCDGTVTDVYLLGGSDAVGLEAEDQLAGLGYCVQRIAGPTRVETSVTVAAEILRLKGVGPDNPDRGRLLVARDDDPADSATAGAYAARFGIPIVVTPGDELHPAVVAALQPGDGAYADVGLLGGTVALSAELEQEAIAAGTGNGLETPVFRVQGATRDDTAVSVATELWPSEVVAGAAIVNGYGDDSWVYALPGAAAAARQDSPLLYVTADGVPEPTDAYLRQTPLTSLLTIGPESRISAATQEAAASALGSAVLAAVK